MQWIEGPVALRRRLDPLEATPAGCQHGLDEAQDSAIGHTLGMSARSFAWSTDLRIERTRYAGVVVRPGPEEC